MLCRVCKSKLNTIITHHVLLVRQQERGSPLLQAIVQNSLHTPTIRQFTPASPQSRAPPPQQPAATTTITTSTKPPPATTTLCRNFHDSPPSQCHLRPQVRCRHRLPRVQGERAPYGRGHGPSRRAHPQGSPGRPPEGAREAPFAQEDAPARSHHCID